MIELHIQNVMLSIRTIFTHEQSHINRSYTVLVSVCTYGQWHELCPVPVYGSVSSQVAMVNDYSPQTCSLYGWCGLAYSICKIIGGFSSNGENVTRDRS